MLQQIARLIVQTGKTYKWLKYPCVLALALMFGCVALAEYIAKAYSRLKQGAGSFVSTIVNLRIAYIEQREMRGRRKAECPASSSVSVHRPAVRIASAALAGCIILTLLPMTALAAEIGGSRVCTHHTHDASCGYAEEITGADCTFQCALCQAEDSQLDTLIPAICICTEECTAADEENGIASNINPDCSACSAENANLASCIRNSDGDLSDTASATEDCAGHTAHDGACGFAEETAAQPCGHVNEDGSYICSPAPEDVNYACDHGDDCGYTEEVAGAPCTHTCELCAPPELVPCTCLTLCTADALYADCARCAAEGADLASVCGGEAPSAPPLQGSMARLVKVDKIKPELAWSAAIAAIDPVGWYGATVITANASDNSGEVPTVTVTAGKAARGCATPVRQERADERGHQATCQAV